MTHSINSLITNFSAKRLFALLLLSGTFLILALTQPTVGQTVIIHSDFSEDGDPAKDDDGTRNGVVVWKGGVVHVALIWYSVGKGQTLEIKPGAIVKIAGTFVVDASGTVTSWTSRGFIIIREEGTIKIDDAIITDIRDDSERGDTNQDGDKSLPHAGEYYIALTGTSKGYIKSSTIKYSSIYGYGSLNFTENKFLKFLSWGYQNIYPLDPHDVPMLSRNTFEFDSYGGAVSFTGVAPIVDGNTFRYAKDAILDLSSLGEGVLRINLWTDPSTDNVYPQYCTAIIANNLFETDWGINISPWEISKAYGFRVDIHNNKLFAPGLNKYKGDVGLQLSFNATMVVTNNEFKGYRFPLSISYGNKPMDFCGLEINNNQFSKSPLPGTFTVLGPPESIWKKGITVNAKNNYWGDPTGPYDFSDADGLFNERGRGIDLRDGIDYVPFIGGTTPPEKDVVYITASSSADPQPLQPKSSATINVTITNFQLKTAKSGKIYINIRDAAGFILNPQSQPVDVTTQDPAPSFTPINIQVPDVGNAITVEAILEPKDGKESAMSNLVRFIVSEPKSDFEVTSITEVPSGRYPELIEGNTTKIKFTFQYTLGSSGNGSFEIDIKIRALSNGEVLKDFPMILLDVPAGMNMTAEKEVEVEIPLRDILLQPKGNLYCQVTLKDNAGEHKGVKAKCITISETGNMLRIRKLEPLKDAGDGKLARTGRRFFLVGEKAHHIFSFDCEIKTNIISGWELLDRGEFLDKERKQIEGYGGESLLPVSIYQGRQFLTIPVISMLPIIPSEARWYRKTLKLKPPALNLVVASWYEEIEIRDAIQTVQKAVPEGASKVSFNPIPVSLDFSSNQNTGTAFAEEFVGQFGSSDAQVKQNMLMKTNASWYWKFIPLNKYWSVYDTLKDGTFSATISFTYDPATDFPSVPGFNEDSLVITGLNPLSGELEALPSTLDKSTHTITTEYTKFFDTWVVASKATEFVTSISSDESVLPERFALEQNYPNPFNPSTTISWQLAEGRKTTIKVYDMLGREVATLVDEYKPAGKYETVFNAIGSASGIYFYRLQAGEFSSTKKIILMK
jgi:hypothetical protein